MQFSGEITRGVTTRSAQPSVVRGWTDKRMVGSDFARTSEDSEEKKGESGGMGREMAKEMPGQERKRGNEEIFALSRACHAVPREKNLPSFFLFLSFSLSIFFVSLSLSLSLSLSSSKSDSSR